VLSLDLPCAITTIDHFDIVLLLPCFVFVKFCDRHDVDCLT
jgi:hypothetical protein